MRYGDGALTAADGYVTRLGTIGARMAAVIALVLVVGLVTFDGWTRVTGLFEGVAGLIEGDANGVESVQASGLGDAAAAALGPSAGLGGMTAAELRARWSAGLRRGAPPPLELRKGAPSGGNPNNLANSANGVGNTVKKPVGDVGNTVGNTVNGVGNTVKKPVGDVLKGLGG